MHTIGLLGGTSWPSTIEYYRLLNQLVQDRLGGHHSANLILWSIDFHAIKSRYHHAWDEIPGLLRVELERLCRLGPDCVLVCNNTLHKALDLLDATFTPPVPVFHMVQLTAAYAAQRGLRRVLLLGTQFTMEDGYYHRHLERYGIEAVVPGPSERVRVQEIQSELSRGVVRDAHRSYLAELIAGHAGVDGVVLGRTELPLVVEASEHTIPLLNPVELQCRAAVEFALAD